LEVVVKDILISEDVVSVANFKAKMASWLKRVSENRQVMITQNGKPAGVLISPDEYDRIQEQERFLKSLARGLADAESGKIMSTAELKKFLAGRRTISKG
jgi:antitoxin YefM